MTFSTGDDRSPEWSASGDSILYVAEGYGDLARSDGVVLSVPRVGGLAEAVFTVLQPDRALGPAILAPAIEPGSRRIAYVQLIPGGETVCEADAASCDATDSLPPPPRLQGGRLRVRTPGATSPADHDPTVAIEFDGVELDGSRHPFGLPGVWITLLHPFQRLYNDLGAVPARPSWEPAGGRLVTSDGLRLLTWRPGDPAAIPIPGSEEGTYPAWSPDGSRIAFTRLDRGPELTTSCQHIVFGQTGSFVACVEERTQWPIGRAMIVLISPGGGETIPVTEGSDPTWSPDGSWIYFSRSDGIWRISPQSGVEERIPGADGGLEPAISPDGRELAFVIRDAAGKGDVWVVPLPR
jgi:hypothetical protein